MSSSSQDAQVPRPLQAVQPLHCKVHFGQPQFASWHFMQSDDLQQSPHGHMHPQIPMISQSARAASAVNAASIEPAAISQIAAPWRRRQIDE
jgi:hypothetical protein